jgi:hypothetical protein
MFCKNCGAELAEGAAFCGKCGRATTETAAAQQKNSMPRPLLLSLIILGGIAIAIGINIFLFSPKETKTSGDTNTASATNTQAARKQADPAYTLIFPGCDYANVRWGWSFQKVWDELAASSGRSGIQKYTNNTSMWFAGSDVGISAQCDWRQAGAKTGVEVRELYLFQAGKLVCMGFEMPVRAKEDVLRVLQSNYDSLTTETGKIVRRELLNLANHGYKRELAIIGERTVGMVHTSQNAQGAIIDVTLISAEANH